MRDLIDRKTIVDVLNTEIEIKHLSQVCELSHAIEMIKVMPSIQPQTIETMMKAETNAD